MTVKFPGNSTIELTCCYDEFLELIMGLTLQKNNVEHLLELATRFNSESVVVREKQITRIDNMLNTMRF